jgi:hypothetical protein
MANSLVGASITDAQTALQREEGKGFGLGDVYADSNGNEYMYVQFLVGGASPNFIVAIKADNTAVMATNTTALFGERVGVFTGAAAAVANDFGWAQIFGSVQIQVAASCAANVQLATTVTAGTLDDAVTTGTKMTNGIILTTARAATAGLAPALLNYPTVGVTN